MSRRKLKTTVRAVVPLHQGFLRINRYEIEAEQHGGGTRVLSWEVMERGNAVAVLGYDPVRDEVVLVNELRPGMLAAGDEPFGDNLVAGGISSGEDALAAAVREMREETGLELRTPRIIHPGAYVSSGGTSEKIILVLGFVDTAQAGGVHGNPEESEDILTVVLAAEEFMRRARAAKITDLKTLVAGYWLAEHYEGLRGAR
jgi:ADP-ribose pyrophosphatase